ncbi:hypothetical protein D8B26_002701 [Coccidioides posadasii str. Silveira]|uniref:uncharacterized protein n=1 Tax=Coccidioides posadasii (strain RMSCC 757 / Silveira) TaxID=443226 RepID=UPI001BEE7D3E|nr:hypothetical protein D8B26_002701 [Coccidioides posadasii str. Silveira]
MITSASNFVNSSFAVGHNAVKSILFRIAGIAVHIAAFKLFSLLASVRSAFTSYLMFTEDYIQRFVFIFSRGFSHHAALVLFLTNFLLGAGLYDTLLWGLDSPGYIAMKKNMTGASVKPQMLKRPGYPPTRKFDPRKGVGPRIWLDDEGFSVSPDTYVTFGGIIDEEEQKAYDCPWIPGPDDSASWECAFDNSFAGTFLKDTLIGVPEIHWDDATDQRYLSEYLRPNREDNPWAVLGVGGDTAIMKQMFSITKGRSKHTFLSTAMKISSVYDYNAPFPADEVYDLIKRSWSTDPTQSNDPVIRQISEKIGNASAKNSSFQLGGVHKVENSIAQANFEFLNPEGTPGKVIFSLFRISVVNITLVRSETLPEPGSQNNTGARFFEEIDTSAVLIISGTLGDGSSNISSKAFNQQAFEWLAKNENRLDNLVLSRGYIMAIDPALVTLEISRVRPAMSYLQVLLVILPVVLAAITWGLLRFFAASHYSSSLLANLYATTNVRDTDTSADPQYIHTIPDIDLVRKDGKVLMATSGGVFTHCEEQSNVASVNVANQKLEYPKSSYPPNNNSYYYESPALVPG